MKRIAPAATLVLIVSALACSAGYEAGLAAYESGDYGEAFHLWEPLAQAGDARAQYGLGYMYDKGLGLPQDVERAVDWYLKAAEGGHAEAQYDLAVRPLTELPEESPAVEASERILEDLNLT